MILQVVCLKIELFKKNQIQIYNKMIIIKRKQMKELLYNQYRQTNKLTNNRLINKYKINLHSKFKFPHKKQYSKLNNKVYNNKYSNKLILQIQFLNNHYNR